MRHVFERINRDITTKITAALLAVLLWFIVLNINDPYIDKPLYVELEVKMNTVSWKTYFLRIKIIEKL